MCWDSLRSPSSVAFCPSSWLLRGPTVTSSEPSLGDFVALAATVSPFIISRFLLPADYLLSFPASRQSCVVFFHTSCPRPHTVFFSPAPAPGIPELGAEECGGWQQRHSLPASFSWGRGAPRVLLAFTILEDGYTVGFWRLRLGYQRSFPCSSPALSGAPCSTPPSLVGTSLAATQGGRDLRSPLGDGSYRPRGWSASEPEGLFFTLNPPRPRLLPTLLPSPCLRPPLQKCCCKGGGLQEISLPPCRSPGDTRPKDNPGLFGAPQR